MPVPPLDGVAASPDFLSADSAAHFNLMAYLWGGMGLAVF